MQDQQTMHWTPHAPANAQDTAFAGGLFADVAALSTKSCVSVAAVLLPVCSRRMTGATACRVRRHGGGR